MALTRAARGSISCHSDSIYAMEPRWEQRRRKAKAEVEVTWKQETLDFFFELWMSDRFSLEDCYNACSRRGYTRDPYAQIKSFYINYPLGAHRASAQEALEEGPWNKQIYGYPRIKRSTVVP